MPTATHVVHLTTWATQPARTRTCMPGTAVIALPHRADDARMNQQETTHD